MARRLSDFAKEPALGLYKFFLLRPRAIFELGYSYHYLHIKMQYPFKLHYKTGIASKFNYAIPRLVGLV